jgi:hypothetical protein
MISSVLGRALTCILYACCDSSIGTGLLQRHVIDAIKNPQIWSGA